MVMIMMMAIMMMTIIMMMMMMMIMVMIMLVMPHLAVVMMLEVERIQAGVLDQLGRPGHTPRFKFKSNFRMKFNKIDKWNECSAVRFLKRDLGRSRWKSKSNNWFQFELS